MWILFVVALLVRLIFDAVVGVIAQVRAEQINRAYKQLKDESEDNSK